MKEEKFVILLLEKGDEVTELRFKWNKLKQKAHAAKDIAKHARNGWQLLSVSGNAEAVDQIKRILAGYKSGDAVPVKKMMKEAGLQAMPGFLKKRLEKEDR